MVQGSFKVFRLFLGYSLTLSVVAGLLFPVRGAVDDYRTFFFEHARWFFGLLVLANGLDVIEVYWKAEVGIRAVPTYYVPSVAALILGLVVGALTKNERYHAVLAPFALLWALGYVAAVFGPVG